jgi:hypothetical protein
VHKVFAAALAFLALAPFGFAETAATSKPASPEVTITVYDYAHVSPELLQAAQGVARKTFWQAGIESSWVTCLPKPEKVQSHDCYFLDATHLTVKILPRAISAQARARSNVLGDALVDEKGTGYHAYVFYDRVQNVADARRLGPDLLGSVLAHEIGHLLLGSKSHTVSGIMSAHWSGEELRKISEGTMLFNPSQSWLMRSRVSAGHIDVPAYTHASSASSAASL